MTDRRVPVVRLSTLERDLPKVSRGGDTAAKSGGEFSEQDSSLLAVRAREERSSRQSKRARARERVLFSYAYSPCALGCVLAHERAYLRACLLKILTHDRPSDLFFLAQGRHRSARAKSILTATRFASLYLHTCAKLGRQLFRVHCKTRTDNKST